MAEARALAELQLEFMAALRTGDRRILPELADGPCLAPALGLGIYVNAYGARLREALENDHACLGLYLGNELWERLCAGYIAARPSSYRSLRFFGDCLPGYLAEAEPFAVHPQIAELAAFERRLLDSFDSADAERVSWMAVLSLPAERWPDLRLRFHPSLQRHRAQWNSVEIWQALKSGTPPPAPDRAPEGGWMLWRDTERVSRFRSLDAVEARGLDHFLSGGRFSGFCEVLSHWHGPDQIPELAVRYLQRWFADGWICR